MAIQQGLLKSFYLYYYFFFLYTYFLFFFIMQRFYDRNLGQNKLKKLPQDIFSNYTKLKAL